ncbi:MAG: hypothetical protein OIF51_14760, partial [Cellvibrionaceae bacterium]|nr:hypothetical protein [Cellvibrionaceae bacterium]
HGVVLNKKILNGRILECYRAIGNIEQNRELSCWGFTCKRLIEQEGGLFRARNEVHSVQPRARRVYPPFQLLKFIDNRDRKL